MFKGIVEKIEKWYFGLPWWGKILGFLVLVLLSVLVILKFVLGGGGFAKSKSDEVHSAGVEEIIEAGEKKDQELVAAIATAEGEVAKTEAEGAVAEGVNTNLHDAVANAGSFSAVDKIVKKLPVFLLVFFLPFVAYAEEYAMPAGKDVNINGVAMRAFTLDEYKTMANIYIDYKYLLAEKARITHELDLYKGMKDLYEQRDGNCKGMLLTMTSDRDFWKARLDEVQADHSDTLVRVGLIGGLVIESAALVVWGAYSLSQ